MIVRTKLRNPLASGIEAGVGGEEVEISGIKLKLKVEKAGQL